MDNLIVLFSVSQELMNCVILAQHFLYCPKGHTRYSGLYTKASSSYIRSNTTYSSLLTRFSGHSYRDG